MSAGLFETGIGQVVIARFKLSGEAEVGVFLVDVYCLGVKNAFFHQIGPGEFEEVILAKMFPDVDPAQPMSPACARKLVEGAVAYAGRLGFPPHSDYRAACRVLGGIKAEECGETFTFGEDGKPHFMQGPHDSPKYAGWIVEQLRRTCGDGNFHFTVVDGAFDAPE